MTRLLETGCLETDDAVVAACHLGREVCIDGLIHDRTLYSITEDVAPFCTIRHNGSRWARAILIPAATLAAVCTDLEIRDFIRNRAKCETWEWMSWMDTHHTQEDK